MFRDKFRRSAKRNSRTAAKVMEKPHGDDKTFLAPNQPTNSSSRSKQHQRHTENSSNKAAATSSASARGALAHFSNRRSVMGASSSDSRSANNNSDKAALRGGLSARGGTDTAASIFGEKYGSALQKKGRRDASLPPMDRQSSAKHSRSKGTVSASVLSETMSDQRLGVSSLTVTEQEPLSRHEVEQQQHRKKEEGNGAAMSAEEADDELFDNNDVFAEVEHYVQKRPQHSVGKSRQIDTATRVVAGEEKEPRHNCVKTERRETIETEEGDGEALLFDHDDDKINRAEDEGAEGDDDDDDVVAKEPLHVVDEAAAQDAAEGNRRMPNEQQRMSNVAHLLVAATPQAQRGGAATAGTMRFTQLLETPPAHVSSLAAQRRQALTSGDQFRASAEEKRSSPQIQPAAAATKDSPTPASSARRTTSATTATRSERPRKSRRRPSTAAFAAPPQDPFPPLSAYPWALSEFELPKAVVKTYAHKYGIAKLYPWQRCCLYEYNKAKFERAVAVAADVDEDEDEEEGDEGDEGDVKVASGTKQASGKRSRTPINASAACDSLLASQDTLSPKAPNLIYCAPTSGGKTLVAELIMFKRIFETGKKVMFIVPFVAVAEEKTTYFEELCVIAGKRVRCHAGGKGRRFVTEDIIVCTPEKANILLNVLAEGGKLSELGMVVVDELHQISDASRGYVVELLLTKLVNLSRMLNHHITIIGMSATLANIDKLAEWMGGAVLFITDYRPVPLAEHYVVDRTVYSARTHEALRQLPMDAARSVSNEMASWKALAREGVVEGFQVLTFCASRNACSASCKALCNDLLATLSDEASKAAAAAAAKTNEGANSPLLKLKPINPAVKKTLFVSTIAGGDAATAVAAPTAAELTVAKLREHVTARQSERKALADQLKQQCSYGDAELRRCFSEAAVAYHHAALTSTEKQFVEKAFRDGLVLVLFATNTLGAGVNLPVRRVIFQQPRFGISPLTVATYKQAAGRAGRAGMDTLGETFLIGRPMERAVLRNLVSSALPSLESNFAEGNRGMMRVLLEGIHSQQVHSVFDIDNYIRGTLLSASVPYAELHRTTKAALELLENGGFVAWENDGFCVTTLGEATVASSIAPEDALFVHAQLSSARSNLCLAVDLHLVYHCVPPMHAAVEPDWKGYYLLYEAMGSDVHAVGDLVGVDEGFLFRCQSVPPRRNSNAKAKADGAKNATASANDNNNNNSEADAAAAADDALQHQLIVHRRFYCALVLLDVVNEAPHDVVAARFHISHGEVQRLMEVASAFAAMTSCFCSKLGWWYFPPLFEKISQRLQRGVEEELVPLVAIPGVAPARARALFKKGYRTVLSIACANPFDLEKVLNVRGGAGDGAAAAAAGDSSAGAGPHGFVMRIMRGAKDVLAQEAKELEETMQELVGAARGGVQGGATTPSPLLRRSASGSPLSTGMALSGSSGSGSGDVGGDRARDHLHARERFSQAKVKFKCIPVSSSSEPWLDFLRNDWQRLVATSLVLHFPERAAAHLYRQPVAITEFVRSAAPDGPLSKAAASLAGRRGDDDGAQGGGGEEGKGTTDGGEVVRVFFLQPRVTTTIHLELIRELLLAGVHSDEHGGGGKAASPGRSRRAVVLHNCQHVMKRLLHLGVLTIDDVAQIFCGDRLAVNAMDNSNNKAGALEANADRVVVLDPLVADWMLFPDERSKIAAHNVGKNTQMITVERLCHLHDCGASLIQRRQVASSVEAECYSAVLACVAMDRLLSKLETHGLLRPYLHQEMPIIASLVHMERHGICFDATIYLRYMHMMTEKVTQLQGEAFALTGGKNCNNWSLSSPKDCAVVLFDILGLPSLEQTSSVTAVRKSKRKKVVRETRSTKANVLKQLTFMFPDSRMPRLIKEFRTMDGWTEKFIQPLLQAVVTSGSKCKVFGTYTQFATATGRLSMQDPNLQTIPKPISFELDGQTVDLRLRSAFVAPPGFVLLSCDYAQIEARLLAHYSQDPALLRAFREDDDSAAAAGKKKKDVFVELATELFDVASSQQVTTEQRAHAKALCYGMIYGKGKGAIADDLEIPEEEAEQLLLAFRQKYRVATEYANKLCDKCRRTGHVETIAGRKRWIANISSPNAREQGAAERQAINSLCQGSAADMIKVAMNKLLNLLGEAADAGAGDGADASTRGTFGNGRVALVHQIHDELLFQVHADVVESFARVAARVMSSSFADRLSVRFPVRAKYGPSWDDMTTTVNLTSERNDEKQYDIEMRREEEVEDEKQ